MRTTIRDVAKDAGVSIATVSRVLNGKAKVSEETLLKVQASINKLEFNLRTMINQETKSIGMIVPQLSNEFWALISEAIQDALWQKGYTLLLCSTDHDLEREKEFLNMFVRRKLDGIILGASASKLVAGDYGHIEQLKKYNIPIVSLDPDIPGISCVVGDNLNGATAAVEHLLRLGNRRIAYIGGPAVSMEREFGYRKALAMGGVPVDESLIRIGKAQSFAFGREAVSELAGAAEPFSAVFCGNDLIAMGVVKGLLETGIRVPEDIAVVGYDDIHIAGILKPGLTTVRQPIRQMARELIDLLLSLLEDDSDQEPAYKKIVIPTELVVRESCGAQLNTALSGRQPGND